MARPWSRALGPYRFWTRPSTSSVSTSFICTNKHGSELEKGGEGEVGNERRRLERLGGQVGDVSFFIYLFTRGWVQKTALKTKPPPLLQIIREI